MQRPAAALRKQTQLTIAPGWAYHLAMEAASVDRLAGEGFVLRPITHRDTGLLVEASRTDIPDWTYLPRDLQPEDASTMIERTEAVRQSGLAIRFVIDVEDDAVGTVGAAHPSEQVTRG